jgi:hypothetical protein
MLEDLQASVTDPETGVSLVADFFRADSTVLEACDDSNDRKTVAGAGEVVLQPQIGDDDVSA